MATVTARMVNDEDYALLSEDAARHGRSVSEELRLMIADRARKLKAQKHIEAFRLIGERAAGLWGDTADSVAMVRAVRDEE